MSQTTKPAKVRIYNKNPGTLSTGANTTIEIDGVKVPYATFAKIEIKAKGLAKVTIEMIAEVEVDLDGDLSIKETKPLDFNKAKVVRLET